MESIKEEITKVNNRLSEVEERNGKLEDRTQNTEEVLTNMLKLNMQLEDKLMELESRSRCENMRIYGVTEGTESECVIVVAFIENLLRNGLKLSNNLAAFHIERAHRSLGLRPPEDVATSLQHSNVSEF